MSFEASLSTLAPELFQLVADHLPLHARPPTLLSLALLNHDFYGIVYPLLCSCIILRNENDAINVLQRILSDEQFGRAVRQLHIMSELSLAARNGEKPFDTVTGLKKVVAAGSLPYLHTLSIHLLHSWHADLLRHYITEGYGQLEKGFWKELRRECPHLRGIFLSGIGDREYDPWLEDSGIYGLNELQGLLHLGLSFSRVASLDGINRLLTNIRYLSFSLDTFTVEYTWRMESPSAILSLDFPVLRSLTLGSFSVRNISEAMAFWRRHPLLERLRFSDCRHKDLWFDETIESGILPNLRHLATNFNNARILVHVLPQLISLSFVHSYNAQVPYLLRSLIPEGLPNLKSLEINQHELELPDILSQEGAMWYETADGIFHEETQLEEAERGILDNYVHSLARGAPNLEELGLHGPYNPWTFAQVSPALREFHFLQRLYYNPQIFKEEHRAAFFALAQDFAESCKSLQTITDISEDTMPYLTAKICRNEHGKVEDAIPIEGWGLQIGREDEPFPRSPDPF